MTAQPNDLDFRRHWLNHEPARTLLEALNEMANKLYEQTGRHGITRLSLTSEVGLMLAIAPGTSVDVATCAGSVEVYCERTPRARGKFDLPTGEVASFVEARLQPSQPLKTGDGGEGER